MIAYTKAMIGADLSGILQLQKQNRLSALTPEEILSEGYVTVVHSFDDLKRLNEIENHIVAKEGEKVVAYLLAMTSQSESAIPVLQPMFDVFRQVAFGSKKVSDFNYIVVGQVCVEKAYRGKGILDECYNFYKETFHTKYDFAITEIAGDNLRSLNAHKRIGFQEVYRYTAPDGVLWVIVLWNWNSFTA
jgi:GNAT superfamily N-acetyltransferase